MSETTDNQIANEHRIGHELEEDEIVVEVEQIEDDLQFNRIVKQAKNIDEEIARLTDLKKLALIEAKEEIEQGFINQTRSLYNARSFMSSMIKNYLLLQDIKPTSAGTLKYKVISGTAYLKKQSPKITKNEDKFVDYLLTNNLMQFLKTKESVSSDWAEFKKGIEISDDNQVIFNGEVLDFFEVEPREDKVEIK